MHTNKILRLTIPAIVSAVCVFGQTAVDLKTQSRSVDFSSSAYTVPNKTGGTLPSSCQTGETFFLTSGATGLYGCVTTNTWSVLGGGGATNLTDLQDVTGKQGSSTIVQMASGSPIAGAVLKSSSDGSATASGCTESNGEMVCPSFSTNGTGAGVIALGLGPVPSPPGSGMKNLFFDSTDGKLKSQDFSGNTMNYLGESRVLIGGAGVGTIGDLSADRTINLDFGSETEATAPGTNDWILVENSASPGSFHKVKLWNLPAGAAIDSIDCTSPSNFCLYDDFGSGSASSLGIGTQGWRSYGDTGYTASQQPGESQAPGIVRLQTGTTAGNVAGLNWAGGGVAPFADAGDHTFNLACRLRSGSTANQGIVCGILSSDGFRAGTDRVAAYWDASSGADWIYEVCGGGSCSSIDSGIAAAAGWMRVQISYDGSGSYTFSLYDSTGNLSSGSTKTLCTAASGCDVNGITAPSAAVVASPGMTVVTRTAAASYADVDFFSLKMTGLNR